MRGFRQGRCRPERADRTPERICHDQLVTLPYGNGRGFAEQRGGAVVIAGRVDARLADRQTAGVARPALPADLPLATNYLSPRSSGARHDD